MPIPAAALKTKLKASLDRHDETLRIRLHRAASWLQRAEAETDDADARFVFLWIAFNAAYAREGDMELGQREQLRIFIDKLVAVDAQKRLHAMVTQQFSGPIRVLMENRHVYEPFWRALRQSDTSGQWETSFASSKRVALKALLDNATATVLLIVLDRLYVLRNQLVHGGATWSSRVNRAQVQDGAQILGAIIPVMIDLMIDSNGIQFGPIAYPVVQDP